MRKLILGLALFLAACDSKKESDLEVGGAPGEGGLLGVSAAAWLDSNSILPSGDRLELSPVTLANGGVGNPIPMTHLQVNTPTAAFLADMQADSVPLSKVPFLAFAFEEGAVPSLRHIKSVGGQVVLSDVVVPVECPRPYMDALDIKRAYPKLEESLAYDVMCLPLVNAAVPNFLTPSDSGAYVHEFILSAKHPSKTSATLATKLSVAIIIPDSVITVVPTPDLRALSNRDRLLMTTNDLVGSARRDFPAFAVKSELAPGVKTEWVLTTENITVAIDQELFFEMPVGKGNTPSRPVVSRGLSFYKRLGRIDSKRHFRLRLADRHTGKIHELPANGNTVLELPVTDAALPLDVNLLLDFASDSASKSMAEYVTPFPPVFCVAETAMFQPEEWRQNSKRNDFYACDALTKTKIADNADRILKGVTAPVETFYGSFSYFPRTGASVLGGTSGILSTRLTVSGDIRVGVRSPVNLDEIKTIGTIKVGVTYQLPTSLAEMEQAIRDGRAAPGLDTILTSMQRKGVQLIQNGESRAAFPFNGNAKIDVMH